MSRFVAAGLAAAALLPLALPAQAQNVSRETTRETTTVTRDGNTTTTTTRTTTVGGSIDTEALVDGLAGALMGASGPREPEWRRRAEPARAEDVYGDWLADDGGRDVGDCRYNFRDRAFLGVRGMGAENCPSRLSRVSNWRVENGEVLLYQGASDQNPRRLSLVEGRLLGDGLTLRRVGDDGPGPIAGDDHDRDDDRRGGGWGGRPSEDAYAGTWRHIEVSNTGHRRECTVRLTINAAFGALQGSASGCFEDLMFVNSWRLEDRQLVLYKAGGGTVAILRGGPNRLSGRTPEGEEIVLYR